MFVIAGCHRGVTVLSSSVIVRGADWEFVTDLTGQPVGPIFKGTAVLYLTLEDRADKSSRSVGHELSIYTA